MSWGAIGGSVASAVVGSALSKEGGGSSSSSGIMTTPVHGGGLFDTNINTGQISLTQPMREAQQNLFSYAKGIDPFQKQAGALGLGFLNQVGSFDPFEAAATQAGRMNDIMAPEWNRQNLSLENRLFQQGRLGSTGGSQQQGALYEAQNQQQAKNLVDALGQAQNIQGNLINRGLLLGKTPMQMQTQALNNLFGMNTSALNQMRAGIVGGTSQGPIAPTLMNQLGQGLLAGGASGLANADWGSMFGGSDPWNNQNPAGWGTVPGSQQSQMLASQW
jgi:hypothetical protein